MATIIFDLDGTLVDSAPDLIDTLNIILGREGSLPSPMTMRAASSAVAPAA
jgi:phosphoglycolate phosphatase